MPAPPPTLHYEQRYPRPRRSPVRGIVGGLATLSLPVVFITGLAAFDAATNRGSDFVFEGWIKLFAVSCLFPVWWISLRITSTRGIPTPLPPIPARGTVPPQAHGSDR